jgi:hypothetical protein
VSEQDDGFLNRWSRRKQEAAKGATAEPSAQAEAVVTENELPDAAAKEEEFDVSTLPPIESITAGTDIRAFLAKGVPAALTQAALRKMWSADPAIRDYVGLSEYSWDFNSPGQYGFGELDPSINIQEMVAEAYGKVKEAVAKTDALTDQIDPDAVQTQAEVAMSEPPRSVELRPEKNESGSAQTDGEHAELQTGDKNAQAPVAPQQSNDSDLEIPVQSRRHGSALPS